MTDITTNVTADAVGAAHLAMLDADRAAAEARQGYIDTLASFHGVGVGTRIRTYQGTVIEVDTIRPPLGAGHLAKPEVAGFVVKADGTVGKRRTYALGSYEVAR